MSAASAPAKPFVYLIGPGDVLNLYVWKEPELTREVTVRLDGRITLPLLGDVEASGRTPPELSADIGKALGRFLATPNVSVGVHRPVSTQFYVLGQVAKPGDYPLARQTTVLQALAIAGGFKEYAKTDDIVIIRQERGSQTLIPVNYKRLESGKDLSQNIPLQPGDTVVVP